ncbi:hypothetical protein KUH32_15690 [Thalassococcus sp. CAU 1522]|uniref:Uncharacterized protein n=1 Tax=Thalassococcus arenae TaxID=2851652 RepID=A0ABS6NB02_9RHOB|nr:hypothetical protein [Thalassococcus arenae]MBV2361206.1 hypothetical protein [Thalassococcus arenae]
MVGNATEEGLLTQLRYPGHADPARFAGLGGSAVAVVVTLLSWQAHGAVALAQGAIAGFAIGVVLYRILARCALEREAAAMQARRDEEEAEARKQIAAAKKG